MLDPLSSDVKPMEEKLLLRSHTQQRTDELLKDRYSLNGSQKPLIVLGGTTGELNKPVRPKAKPRRSKQRKVQAENSRTAVREFVSNALKHQKMLKKLNKVDKKSNISKSKRSCIIQEIPRYEDYSPLNKLWNSYIADLLFGHLKEKECGKWPDNIDPISLTPKLSTADFHGALLSVVSSRNPCFVGVRGVVIWESKNSFIIVEEAKMNEPKGLKMVEKKGTIFQFTVFNGEDDKEGHKFEIIGSRFMYRTADRSGRKFKPHSVDDL